MTLAIFMSEGKMPAEKEKLKREDRMLAISGIIGLRTFISMLSKP